MLDFFFYRNRCSLELITRRDNMRGSLECQFENSTIRSSWYLSGEDAGGITPAYPLRRPAARVLRRFGNVYSFGLLLVKRRSIRTGASGIPAGAGFPDEDS